MTAHRPTNFRLRATALAAIVGLALLVAACGSSSNSGTTKPASTSPTTHTAVGLTIGTASNSSGTYLTGAGGRSVYMWMADSTNKSKCSGACALNWPPLIAKNTPKAGSGVTASDISLITRSNGAKQVAYKGHPLYYYIGDSGSGQTNGQGSNGFGARWWLVSPSGTAITKSSGSSSGGGY